MSGPRKSQRLRRGEILAAQRLVMKCAELWYDPAAWRARLLEGLRELTQATIVGCEHYEIRPKAPDGSSVASSSQGDWPSARARDEFHAWQERTPVHLAHPPEVTRRGD